MNKHGLAPPPAQRWTRIDTYLAGMVRQRSASRRRLGLQPRSEPEKPLLLLSTLPFVSLLAVLAMLFFAIAILAWPQPAPRAPAPAAENQLGTAPKGWFQEAEKEFSKAPPSQRRG